MEVIVFLALVVGYIGFNLGAYGERSKARNEKLRQHTARIEALLTPVPVESEGALPGEELEKLPGHYIHMSLVEQVAPAAWSAETVTPIVEQTVEPMVILSTQPEVFAEPLVPISSDEPHVDLTDPVWNERRYEARIVE
jgi:hypothetical protein